MLFVNNFLIIVQYFIDISLSVYNIYIQNLYIFHAIFLTMELFFKQYLRFKKEFDNYCCIIICVAVCLVYLY